MISKQITSFFTVKRNKLPKFKLLLREKKRRNMKWQQLISNIRLGQEHTHAKRHDDRS